MKRLIIWAVVLVAAVIGLCFWLDRRPEPSPIALAPPSAPAAQHLHYDLIVVGSDPEGIAAAVSGARNGLSTLLVDTRPVLGGLMTRGWLNTIDMNYAPGKTPGKEILNKGIFLEFFEQIEGDSFDVGTASQVFNQLVENEPNIQVLLGAAAIEPVVTPAPDADGPAAVTGILVTEQGGGERPFTADIVIDATQDADLAALAGVDYSYGQEDMGYEDRNMPVTLVFQMKGISRLDWLQLGFNLVIQRLTGTPYVGINTVSAWGFGEVMSGHQSGHEQVGIRGLNIGRQKDGTVLVNALHVYNIDPLDKQQVAEAHRLAEQEIPGIIEYFREHIAGFSHAELFAVAPELYVRESRHIYSEYRLTVDDVLENRDFPDTIACGSYPIDIQALDANFKGAIVGVPKQYGVPLRTLIPRDFNGLMVVGRSAGFDSLAHGSARVIPVGMATGQAAGAAAALSIAEGVPVGELSKHEKYITELRQRLNRQGMELQPFQYQVPETKHWSYPGLKFMRSYGLVFGGYENDYDLDEEISEGRFINLLLWLTKLTDQEQAIPQLYTEGNALTVQDISYMVLQYLGPKDLSKEQSYQFLLKQDFFTPQVLQQIDKNNGKITNGTAYMILKSYASVLHSKRAGRSPVST